MLLDDREFEVRRHLVAVGRHEFIAIYWTAQRASADYEVAPPRDRAVGRDEGRYCQLLATFPSGECGG